MEISEIVKIFRDKVVELQKFFKITDEPETVYAHSFQFAQALETAADILSAENDREKIVVQLRKQWQDAEMFICTMCGHFDHKADGNIVYGNQDCDEIVGYPYCKKFTPWISVADRLPEKNSIVIVAFTYAGVEKQFAGVVRFTENDGIPDWEHIGMKISHWMPMPELPKEAYK